MTHFHPSPCVLLHEVSGMHPHLISNGWAKSLVLLQLQNRIHIILRMPCPNPIRLCQMISKGWKSPRKMKSTRRPEASTDARTGADGSSDSSTYVFKTISEIDTQPAAGWSAEIIARTSLCSGIGGTTFRSLGQRLVEFDHRQSCEREGRLASQ